MVPKMALIRKNGGLDVRFMFATPKRHILGRNGVFWRILCQNPSRALGCSELQEPEKKPKTNTFLVRKVTHAQKRYAWVDRDKLLHRCRDPRRNHLCRFVLRSLTLCGRGGGSNFGFLHWLASSPLQHSRTTVRVCDIAILYVRPSVCLSVRNVPVSDENGSTYCHNFFHSPYSSPNIFTKFRRGHPLRRW